MKTVPRSCFDFSYARLTCLSDLDEITRTAFDAENKVSSPRSTEAEFMHSLLSHSVAEAILPKQASTTEMPSAYVPSRSGTKHRMPLDVDNEVKWGSGNRSPFKQQSKFASPLSINCVEKGSLHHLNNSIRLNNNILSSLEGLLSVLGNLIPQPARSLKWLDLSSNKLERIGTELFELKSLEVLYLHSNNISSFSEVEKLLSLCKLWALTLMGNPLEKHNHMDYR